MILFISTTIEDLIVFNHKYTLFVGFVTFVLLSYRAYQLYIYYKDQSFLKLFFPKILTASDCDDKVFKRKMNLLTYISYTLIIVWFIISKIES